MRGRAASWSPSADRRRLTPARERWRLIDRDALRDRELTVACDVRTPFLDAARIFAAQKGATPEQVRLLSARLARAAARYRAEFGVDVTSVSGGGAAGGLAGGLHVIGATLVDGFAVVARHTDFEDKLPGADLVFTGEGCLDRTSLAGKVVGGVLSLARRHQLPAAVIAGRVVEPPAGTPCSSLIEVFGHRRATTQTVECVRRVAHDLLGRQSPNGTPRSARADLSDPISPPSA
jgi:glycerate 2-kinase